MKIAIASGKGGTGKTTLSTNLSLFLSETMDIKLVDLDVEEPNSGLFLNLQCIEELVQYSMRPKWEAENCTLCGKCQKVCNFNAVIKLGDEISIFPELCKSCYACSELCPTNSLPMHKDRIGVVKHYRKGKLTFIEGRMDIGQENASSMIGKTITFANNRKESALTIYDAPPGASCPAIEATKSVDLVILVTEPTPFGLNDLAIAVDTMRKLDKEPVVVINRDGIGDDGVINYCEKENIKIIAKIPNSKEVARLYSTGQIVYDKVAEVKTELIKIKEYILEKKQGEKI